MNYIIADHARELVAGPQDGAKVTWRELPEEWIFVGPQWQGDGFAAWGRARSKRFPVGYALRDGKYYHESILFQ